MKPRLLAGTLLLAVCFAPAGAVTRQQHVRANGMKVMPFSMGATMHTFASDAKGGVMTIVTRKRNSVQEALIREHLRKEAAAFAAGNYADPAAIHGATMAGLSALSAGSARVDVRYSPVPNGGRITFRSRDRALITALHHWFAAQISDHGPDAMRM